MNNHFTDATDEERIILDTIGKWLEKDVKPHVLRLEHVDEYRHEMADQMAEIGLFGATIPVEYGGLDLTEPDAGTDLQPPASVSKPLTRTMS